MSAPPHPPPPFGRSKKVKVERGARILFCAPLGPKLLHVTGCRKRRSTLRHGLTCGRQDDQDCTPQADEQDIGKRENVRHQH